MNQDELIRFVNAFNILQFGSSWKYANDHLSLCIRIQETTQIWRKWIYTDYLI